MPSEGSFVESLSDLVYALNDIVWGWPDAMPLLVVVLVGTGLLTTLRLGFIQLRRFGHGIRVVRGEYDDPEHEGDISHFQALTTALSATVGIGNIAGVGIAIHYGGPGALFWMWVTAFFGMALKYTEVTLAMRYRRIGADGSASGGPMYYIEQGLGKGWKFLAVAFACFAVVSSFGSGNAVQSFTVADQFRNDLSVPTWATGLVMATLVGLVILGGIKRIGIVTSKLVPIMGILYVFSGLLVLLIHYEDVIPTLGLIVTSAFKPAAATGGFAGGTFVFMLTWGIKRGLFSNESGQGSAPIAHAAAKTDQPVREGVVALLEPFIDTLVICSITGLVICTTGVWQEKELQQVLLNEQASVQAIGADAMVPLNGEPLEEDLVMGEFEVVDGVPRGFQLVLNEGTVDDPFLLFARESKGVVTGRPFTGTIRFGEETAGNIALARLFDAEGEILEGNLRMEGKALQNGSPLTSWAFREGLGGLAFGHGHLLVTLAVFLFGISTGISWSYYGDRAIQYLAGDGAILPYKIVFCIMHFLGAIYPLGVVWSFGDTALGLMTFPNLLAILLLTGKVNRMGIDYVRDGGLEPPRRNTPV